MPVVLRYALARLGIFVVVGVVLYLFGFRAFALVLTALVLSLPLSYAVLRNQRGALTEWINRKSANRRAEKAKLRAALRGDD